MSMETSVQTNDQDGFTAETFAQFWAAPVLSETTTSPIAEDVTGYWPGDDEPLQGREAYVGALAELLQIVPDLTLTVAASAQEGEHIFIRWVAHATGGDGLAMEHSGVDVIKVQDGKVVENRIFFDRAQFESKLGRSLALDGAASVL